MSSIKNDPKYKELKGRLDALIREHTAYVNQWAQENEEPTTPGESLFVTGWILGIAVTGATEDGEFDDLLPESNEGINTYMARGMAIALEEVFMPGGDDEDG